MADLQFPDIGNALLAGSQAGYSQSRARREAEQERRRLDAQPFIEPAVRGDAGAFAKLAAGDPATASAVAMALSRMDAGRLAKAKEATDYTTGVTTGLLAAPPEHRERLYQQTLTDAQARGIDTSRWPKNYDPAWVQMQHGYGIGAKEWFQQQQQNQRHDTPAGGASIPTQVDMPGGVPASLAPMPAPATSPSSVPLVDNNSGNIRATGANSRNGFATYPTAQDGANAHFDNYAAYVRQNPTITVGQALAKWSPPTENDTRGLTRTITQASGVDPNMPLAQLLQNPELASRFLMAQTQLEKGRIPSGFTPQVFAQAASRGVPGQIATVPQGDSPRADGSGTPLAPQGGQPKRNGAFFEEEPSQFGYVQRGVRDKYGNVTPMTVEGGYFVYRNPQTNEHVLYKRAPVAQPPAGYRPDSAGNLEFVPGGPADPGVVTRQAESKRIAAEKAIPQTVTKGMQENVNSLKQLDRIEAELAKNEGSVGGVGSTIAAVVPGAGMVQNRWGDPAGTQLRALIADVGSMKIHDRSGAAVTASEFPRLRPFIPSISDDAKTVRAKLANFRAEYASLLADTVSYYGPENGFRAYTPATDYLEGRTRGEPGTPAPEGLNEQPKAAPAPATPAGGGKLQMPRLSPADAAKLPSGTPFVGEDGIPRVRN